MPDINDILNFMKKDIESQILIKKYFTSNGNQNGFELLFNDVIIPNVKRKFPTINIDFIGGKRFPDVDITIGSNKYGIELKSTQDGSWTIPGNSALESQSSSGYTMIYLFFGTRPSKTLNKYCVKYDEYWKVASQIKVTHSPRFVIDMNTTNSFFTSNTDYETFRRKNKSDKSTVISKYLKDNISGPTWYLPSNDVFVYEFSELEHDEQQKLRALGYILFPKDLITNSVLNHKNDYSNFAKYLIVNHSVYSSNLRDKFSAAGKGSIQGVEVSKSLYNFYLLSNEVKDILTNASPDFVKELRTKYWGYKNSKMDPLKRYYQIIDSHIKVEYADELKRMGTSKFSTLL